ncbi:DUF3088 family protein [Kiloniella majae]|uniref:DUF3088 family protein n=1 Tax=Kiloniella majae TaxID=1938558 RepID=UPI001C3FB50D|nr:DUF3088 family protein [Kiloniella majae]
MGTSSVSEYLLEIRLNKSQPNKLKDWTQKFMVTKPVLFILKMPFEDKDLPSTNKDGWFCTHCAMIEGALSINPHWLDHIEVRRIDHAKPRTEVIEYLGKENQWLPVLIINDTENLTDPKEITSYLANHFGGAAPHP